MASIKARCGRHLPHCLTWENLDATCESMMRLALHHSRQDPLREHSHLCVTHGMSLACNLCVLHTGCTPVLFVWGGGCVPTILVTAC
jgi:hypothetical protein